MCPQVVPSRPGCVPCRQEKLCVPRWFRREQLPAFLAEYAGDTLWALILFLLVSTLLAGRPILVRAAISLALAFLAEIIQFYHAPWIDAIRRTTPTTLGGLVLGFGFLWTDFVCYAVGVLDRCHH